MWKRLLLLLFAPAALMAQPPSGLSPEKFIVGGSAGIFRIAYDEFTNLYSGRSGLIYGGQALYRVYAPYFAVAKLSMFEKDGAVDSTGAGVHWQQRGINLGVRFISYRERRLVSYLGFGFVFFQIKEDGPASIFNDADRRRNATGLFLNGGLEYRFMSRGSVFLDLEVNSAGLKGKSGLQGNSVGGFSVALGLNVFIF